MPTTPSVISIFSAPVYAMEALEFLDVARNVSKKFTDKRKEQVELNETFPVYMTENLHNDPELLDFSNFIAQSSWNILDSQGYAMQSFRTYFLEMWCQEHHKGSFMEKHIHGNNAVISGFYFLDCPKEANVLFHDPRDSKVITGLPEKDINQLTQASNVVTVTAKNGLLVFSNSWLPHSFSRIAEDTSLRFIHFNIAVLPVPPNTATTEII